MPLAGVLVARVLLVPGVVVLGVVVLAGVVLVAVLPVGVPVVEVEMPAPPVADEPAPAPPGAPAAGEPELAPRNTTRRSPPPEETPDTPTRYGFRVESGGIDTIGFTVTRAGVDLGVESGVATDPGASVSGAAVVRVTVVLVLDLTPEPGAYAAANRATHTTTIATSQRTGSHVAGEPA